MEHLTTTPFGRRPVTAGLLAHVRAARARPEIPRIDKWELFRSLRGARAAFGVSDRELVVLNALLSFLPDRMLSDNAPLIVFPSNRALSDRAHGMAESTLRRHLAALVAAGLILRHDSPNGKRYATRDAEGGLARAFGFDLRPLLVRAGEIARAAEAAEAAAERLRRQREAVVLMKRDAAKLAAWGRETGFARPEDWDRVDGALSEAQRVLRRKPAADALARLEAEMKALLAEIEALLGSGETEEMSGCAAVNERHHSNSNPDSPDLEPRRTCAGGQGAPGSGTPAQAGPPPEPPTGRPPANLPLAVVLKACPDILPYADGPLRHWHQLVALAGHLRGMMGISPSAWSEAQRVMGPEAAAVTLAAILQRFRHIKSPGGYLRALTARAADGRFSPGPMVMALLSPGGES